MLKKIVVIGPESTGKSTLCSALAAHYQCAWVPEYAREYLLLHGKSYQYESLLTIAKGQLQLEDQYLQNKSNYINQELLFIDTDMHVMKVWSEFVFGNCDPWILEQIVKRKYDAYLLCNTDLPWVQDELREYPDGVIREKLFHIYRDILINQPLPWFTIKGSAADRLSYAIQWVDEFIFNSDPSK